MIQNATAIVAVVVSLIIPSANFIFNTNATAHKALDKASSVDARLERIENKLDQLTQKGFRGE